MSSMAAGGVPSGIPQPGTGKYKKQSMHRERNTIEALFLDRDIYNFILFLVGGGAAFGSTIPTSGGIQAIAAGLVPTGLTPVAFFPPSPTQQLQALSVIFLEAPLKKRKKRFAEKGSFRFYRMYVNTYPYGSNFLQPFIQVLNI